LQDFDFDISKYRLRIIELKKYTQNMNVLIVEDYLDLLRSLSKIFTTLFSSVEVAVNGAEALEIYKQKKANKESFDIVFSDIVMPMLNGVELAKEIKAIDKNQSIIIFSAHQEVSFLLDFVNIGVERFVSKPISLDELFEELIITCKRVYEEKSLGNIVVIAKDIVYIRKERELYIDNKKVSLTHQERLIFECLITNMNIAVSKSQILEYLWQEKVDLDEVNLRKIFYRLRKKLDGVELKNIYSLGYKLVKNI